MLIPDPVGAGFVENLARPGGNLTGFAVFEYGFGAKQRGKTVSDNRDHLRVLPERILPRYVGVR
jgi:hypothetical protein